MGSTRNEKEVKTDWPVVEGLVAGTTKQTGRRYLVAERKSFLRGRFRKGID